ncbi:MAG: hypothetical protein M3033_00500 [Acidobacteriota bacterium]|nr:hypothetical protein [Acidobacteriota bacterium]
MDKVELKNFYNDGFGWVCKRCERELKEAEINSHEKSSRLLREGEAESKQPTFSNQAMAKWTNVARQTLMCPRCGVTELAGKF